MLCREERGQAQGGMSADQWELVQGRKECGGSQWGEDALRVQGGVVRDQPLSDVHLLVKGH